MFLDRLWRWVDERLRLRPLLKANAVRGINPVYSLGGLSFLFFLILASTGVILALYYSPTPETAYDSVRNITTNLHYGWLIRSVHFYAANCLIIVAIIHMLNSYLKRSYKRPQELNWVVGVLVGAFVLMSGFTGYVLRWDQEAVGAAGIGRGLAVSIPQVGLVLMRFLWGQSETDMAHRFFITHTVLLPGLIVSLLAVHYFMVRKYSIEVLVGEMNLAPLIIGALLVFASIFPMPLGQKYDPMNPPTVLQPEWFFMGLYQFIKTQNVQPIHGVLITIALGFFIVSVPFVERDAEHHSLRRAFFNAAAAFIIVEFLALTIYGYLSPGRVGTFTDSQFTDAFAITNIAALASAGLTLAYSQRHRCPQGSAVPVDRLHPRSRTVSEGIISLATGLVLLESFLAYEAILAHASGSQRTFGILSGLVFFCLAGLLYVASALLASQSKR